MALEEDDETTGLSLKLGWSNFSETLGEDLKVKEKSRNGARIVLPLEEPW